MGGRAIRTDKRQKEEGKEIGVISEKAGHSVSQGAADYTMSPFKDADE